MNAQRTTTILIQLQKVCLTKQVEGTNKNKLKITGYEHAHEERNLVCLGYRLPLEKLRLKIMQNSYFSNAVQLWRPLFSAEIGAEYLVCI